MHEHSRPTRNRREFLRDAFCGFGGLAFASMLHERRARNPLAPSRRTCPTPRRSRSSSCSWPAARATSRPSTPSRCSTSSNGQQRPAEFGEVKYQFVKGDAKLLGTKRTFQKHGKSGIEVSDLFPHTADVRRRPRGDPLVPRRHGRPLGGAVPAVHRPRRSRVSRAWGRGSLYGLGSESESLPAYVVMPDPDGRASKPASRCTQRLPAGGLSADVFRAGEKPVLNLDLPAGVSLDAAPQDARADPRAERGAHDAGRRGVRRAHRRLRPRVQDADRGAGGLRPLPASRRDARTSTASATQPTDDYGRRCLLARRLVEKGVRFVVRRLGGGPGNLAVGRAQRHRGESPAHGRRRPTSRSPACSRT